MPYVSIIIPVYNQPTLIIETVESLRAQRVTDWEAIIVDDGSTDDTPTVLQSLVSQDNRLSILRQAQRGAAAARNSGAAEATADWLLFLDGDDWLAPDALTLLLRAAGKDVDFVHALGIRVSSSNRQDRSQVQLPSGDLFHRLASTATFMIHACLLRNSTFHALGGFDESLMGCADWDLWQRVVRSGARRRGVDAVIAFYRQTEASLSTNYEQELRDGLIVIERGHRHDPRVPLAAPLYAKGISRTEFPSAAYRFASWLAGLAIARGHSYQGIVEGLSGVPPEALFAGDIAAALFDAILIGSGTFSPRWNNSWLTLRDQIAVFLRELANKTASGPSFAIDVLFQIERLAAIASATDEMHSVGSVASQVVRVPGSIPNVAVPREVTSFIAVIRSGRANVGWIEIPVDELFSAGRVRELVVERFLKVVASTYLRHFPLPMLRGMLTSFELFAKRSTFKSQLCQSILAQSFILPLAQTPMPTSRKDRELTNE